MDIDNKTFDEVFEDSRLTEKFLRLLGEYLEKDRGSEAAKAMGRWLKEGRLLSGFTCRADVLGDLVDELYSRQIPFVLIKNEDGEFGILIRRGDEDNAQQTIEDTLKAKARYIKLISAKDFNAALLTTSATDKTVLHLEGLSLEEAAGLIEKMEGSYAGLNVGIDKKQDGTISLLFHAKSVMKKTKSAKPLAFYALQNAIALNGENALANYTRERAKLDAQKKAREILKSPDAQKEASPFIIGEHGDYINISNGQIEYGKFTEGSRPEAQKVESLSPTALKNALAGIKIRGFSQSAEEIPKILNSVDIASERRIDIGERFLASQIDMIVDRRMQSMMITHEEGRWSGKFQAYEKEAASVLEGLATGKVPEGYPKEAMDSLYQICSDFSLEPSDYAEAAQAVGNIATYEDKAKIETKDISRARTPERELSHFSPVRDNVDREELR